MCLNVCLQFWGSGEQAQPQGIFLFFAGQRGGVDPKKSRLLWSPVERGKGDSIMDSVVAAVGGRGEEEGGGGEKLSLPAS